MGKAARTVVLVGLAGAAYLWASQEKADHASERLAQLSRIAVEGTRGTAPTRAEPDARVPDRVTVPARGENGAARSPLGEPSALPQVPSTAHEHAPAATSAEESAAGDTGPMVRSIQAQLKRLGCLATEPDGIWSEPTRQAMRTFLKHINASLPVAEPDDILRALVEGQTAAVCRTPCASGSAGAGDGQCEQRAAAAPAPAAPVVAPLVRAEETKAQQRAAARAAAQEQQAQALAAREARIEAQRQARDKALAQHRQQTEAARETALRQKQIARELAEARRRKADATRGAGTAPQTTMPEQPAPVSRANAPGSPENGGQPGAIARNGETRTMKRVAARPRRHTAGGSRYAARLTSAPAYLGRAVVAPRPVARPASVLRPIRPSLRVRLFSRMQSGAP